MLSYILNVTNANGCKSIKSDTVVITILPQVKVFAGNDTAIDGCRATDDIVIKVFIQADIYVPNAFTPNKDGLNDVVRPILVGIKELKYFAVYNRYGQQVFITSTPGKGWNGTVRGQMRNTGAFAWAAEAVDYKGNRIKKKGMVVLIK